MQSGQRESRRRSAAIGGDESPDDNPGQTRPDPAEPAEPARAHPAIRIDRLTN
jgi:hypothetical protein